MPRVSVIIPNFNHARFLPQRIDSVLGQTYPDLELLILDDVSTDESRDVIERYTSDRRVSVLFNETNSGSPYRQWRKGLAHTAGEYVWIAESDDFADPQFLWRMVCMLDENPTVGIAACDSWVVNSEGKTLGIYSNQWRDRVDFADYDLAKLDQELVMDGRLYCEHYMYPWNTIPNASAAVFRRVALESIGGPFVEMKLCGDWMTYCKILMKFDMARAPEPLNYFRRHAVSVRTQIKSKTFVAESLQVLAFVARELNLGNKHLKSLRVREFFSQALILAGRGGDRNSVPLQRLNAVLRDAAEFGWAMWLHTLRILLKEQAGAMSRWLGVRR